MDSVNLMSILDKNITHIIYMCESNTGGKKEEKSFFRATAAFKQARNGCFTVYKLNPDLRVSSMQCGLSSPADKDVAPESCTSLLPRSRCLRLEDSELRTAEIPVQLFSVRLV